MDRRTVALTRSPTGGLNPDHNVLQPQYVLRNSVLIRLPSAVDTLWFPVLKRRAAARSGSAMFRWRSAHWASALSMSSGVPSAGSM